MNCLGAAFPQAKTCCDYLGEIIWPHLYLLAASFTEGACDICRVCQLIVCRHVSRPASRAHSCYYVWFQQMAWQYFTLEENSFYILRFTYFPRIKNIYRRRIQMLWAPSWLSLQSAEFFICDAVALVVYAVITVSSQSVYVKFCVWW